MPTLDDFPNTHNRKAAIFIQHVRLSIVLGRITKLLAQGRVSSASTLDARNQLIEWTQTLPSTLRLPLSGSVIEEYNHDVLLLHLPYLGTITLLYLKFSTNETPKASIPGIVAASVTARICQELLARGPIRFVPEENVRFISLSVLALGHARQVECLRSHADADLRVLMTTLRQMGSMWRSARAFDSVYSDFFSSELGLDSESPAPATASSDDEEHCGHFHSDFTDDATTSQCPLPACLRELAVIDGVDWMNYFPYGDCQTTPLLGAILKAKQDSVNLSLLDQPIEFRTSMNALFANFEDLYGDLFSIE